MGAIPCGYNSTSTLMYDNVVFLLYFLSLLEKRDDEKKREKTMPKVADCSSSPRLNHCYDRFLNWFNHSYSETRIKVVCNVIQVAIRSEGLRIKVLKNRSSSPWYTSALMWPLMTSRSYFIKWTICVVIILAFIYVFDQIGS